MAFEENLKKLEKVVEELHGEKISLDKAIARFEEGVKLADTCLKALDGMRRRVETITKNKDGRLAVKQADPDEDADTDAGEDGEADA
jgi:exodeoxyribonuclease VII small subunit